MALILFDGFDNRSDDTHTTSKWDYDTGADWITTGGRRNGGRLFFNDDGDYVYKAIAQDDTYILGVAWYLHGDISNNQNLIHFRSGTTDQVSVRFSNYATGVANICAYANGTLLGTSAATDAVIDTWQYFEMKVYCHATAGTVEFKINGTTVLSLTSQNTDPASSGYIDGMILGGIDSDVSYDDFYLLDTSGSTNNNFLGDVKVITLLPTANGAYSQMTPSTGTNYENVDDPDLDTTTYNTADALNEVDTFSVTTPTAMPDIYGLQVCSIWQNPDAGTRKIKNMVYKSTTAYLSTNELILSYSWKCLCTLWETDPVDSMQWNKGKIDAAQFGVKLTQ